MFLWISSVIYTLSAQPFRRFTLFNSINFEIFKVLNSKKEKEKERRKKSRIWISNLIYRIRFRRIVLLVKSMFYFTSRQRFYFFFWRNFTNSSKSDALNIELFFHRHVYRLWFIVLCFHYYDNTGVLKKKKKNGYRLNKKWCEHWTSFRRIVTDYSSTLLSHTGPRDEYLILFTTRVRMSDGKRVLMKIPL